MIWFTMVDFHLIDIVLDNVIIMTNLMNPYVGVFISIINVVVASRIAGISTVDLLEGVPVVVPVSNCLGDCLQER